VSARLARAAPPLERARRLHGSVALLSAVIDSKTEKVVTHIVGL
jgi:hypothetical protein